MSETISQLLDVLARVHSAVGDRPLVSVSDVRDARVNATKAVAQERSINVQPVFGKCARRLGYTIGEFDDAVLRWLRGGDRTLEDRVGEYLAGRRFWPRPDHRVSTSDPSDRLAVQQYFSRHRGRGSA